MAGEEAFAEGGASTVSLAEALEGLVSTAAELGLDLGGRAEELAVFLVAAPACCLVTRPTGAADADGVAGAITDAVPEVRMLRHAVTDRADRPLCDVVVLVTPAEQALSQREEDAVRQAAADGCRVVVLVTDIELLGADSEQQAACSEIERFRLRPALGPLGAQWHFHTVGGSQSTFPALLRQVLADAAGQPHRRPALRALATLVDTAAAQLEGRVEIRRRESARLAELRNRQEPVAGHLHREAGLARMRALDAIRTAEQQLTRVSFVVGRCAVEWAEDGAEGVTPWASVVQPLREAWRVFRRQAEQAVPDACAGFRAECEQALGDDRRAAAMLNVGEPPSPLWAGQWTTAELEEALTALDRCDLDGMLHRLRHCAENAVPDTGQWHLRVGVGGGETHPDIETGTRDSDPWGTSPKPTAQQPDQNAEPGAGTRQDEGNPSRADPDLPKQNEQSSEPPYRKTNAGQERASGPEPPWAVPDPGQAAELFERHLRLLQQTVLQAVNNVPPERAELVGLLQTGMQTVLEPQIKALIQAVGQVVVKAARADAECAGQTRAAWLEAAAAALADRHSWSAGQARIEALRAWCRTEDRLVP
ncbi:hypothetical protein [Streptomyces melanogenes]|uniref:hypothetical protein n=1 Tax=Streptomyces melanogenes TaxID=67326 RepID=UPI0037928939